MYSVKLDEQGYFTGSYAEVGSIPGGIMVDSLPEDVSKATCYKYGTYEVTEHIEVPVYDEESGTQKVDTEGNVVFETKPVVSQITGWQYNEEQYVVEQEKLAIDRIRQQRTEIFKILDRYQLLLVFNELTEEQKVELSEYRKAWLDAPQLKQIPRKLMWLKE